MSLAHGTNDAQKTIGVISLALIAHGNISAAHFAVPVWVKLICATAIALGTATGGWRIINTMGNRITTVESPQGFAAETASASVILASSYCEYPLSTTAEHCAGHDLGRRSGPDQRAASGRGHGNSRRAGGGGGQMTVLASELINWSALWRIVLASLIGGTGVVVIFGVLLLGSSTPTTPRTREAGSSGLGWPACAARSASPRS